MSKYFFLPITRSEFIDWYNRREKKYSAIELIPAELDENKESFEIDSDWKEVLVEIIPEYDEDFEVLIALLEVERKKKSTKIGVGTEKEAVAPYFQKVNILDLRRLYPLTGRGARMLEVRLPSEIELGPPLFEEAIRENEERLMRQQAEAGGTALLEIFDLEINEGQIDGLKREILDAVHTKVRRQGEEPPGSLLEAVIRYDRQDQPSFPSTPIGSCYDYLEVLKNYLREKYKSGEIDDETGTLIREIFQDASTALRNMGRREKPYVATQERQFTKFILKLREATPLDLDQLPSEAAVLFLDLRDQLREDDDLSKTTANQWKEVLQAEGKERALALGLWMVGAFFDFSTFASKYYESKDAYFISESFSSTRG